MNSKLRTGIGVDAHQFGDSGPLALAGLSWPETKKLVGHSDGDAAAHAICDAVLSACQLGDVGSFFGVDKPEMAGASGVVMISAVRDFVTAKGFAINIDARNSVTLTAICQVINCKCFCGRG